MRLLLVACALLTGCATQPPPKPTAARLGHGEILSARSAANALSIGRSTKSDVRAALGEGTVVNFDSGYEVWVYRERKQEKPPAPTADELVLLFEPSGILSKTRVR